VTPAPADRPAAIVFDFDGVIADTERLHLLAFQEVFAARGWTIGEREYFDRYLGFDDRGLVAAFAEAQRVDLDAAAIETLAAAKAHAFGRHIASIDVLFPGTAAHLRRLAAIYPLAIASGALGGEIAAILQRAGLLDLFPIIVGADDVIASKPSPEPYLTAARRMGIPATRCVAVEDSIPGLQAARAAGMRTVAITTTTPRVELGIADRVIDRLDELTPDLLAALGVK